MTTQNEYRSVRLVGEWPSDIGGEVEYYLGSDISVQSIDASYPGAMLPWAELGTLISATAAAITVCLNIWDRLKNRSAVSSVSSPESQLPLNKAEVVELKKAINEKGIFGVEVQRIIITEDRTVFVSIYNEVSAELFNFRSGVELNVITVAIEKDLSN
jgi:hypothetical protein